jgi:superfamily II DNA or RNA helicase
MSGYIYIRRNQLHDTINVCKLGKTTNIPDRHGQYITYEPIVGKFVLVIETDDTILDELEKKTQTYFDQYHIQNTGAGTEYYTHDIIQNIIPYYTSLGIKFNVLTEEEILALTHKQYIKARDYQTEIIDSTITYYDTHDEGVLCLMCGTGKTIISLLIAKRMFAKSIVIGVPNTLLLVQWKNVVQKIFPKYPILLVYGGIAIADIQRFLSTTCIVITTYASSYKLVDLSYTFDLKINDECHHLNASSTNTCDRRYTKMLEIKTAKTLSLTATIKEDQIENIIVRRSMLWAIQHNIICDYSIQTIITEDSNMNELASTKVNGTYTISKELLFVAYAALKSIASENTHHLLIYANSKESSKLITRAIRLLMFHKYFTIEDIIVSCYHGDMATSEQTNILTEFDKSTYGIICCVYCLGEGWDFPKLNGVVFGEEMSSNIRIVQSASRACRKNVHEPDKVFKIIIPCIEQDTNSYKKVKEIVYQIGMEDEMICQKLSVYKTTISKGNAVQHKELGISDEIYTKEFMLKTTARKDMKLPYNRVVKLLKENDIDTKEKYRMLCNRNIRIPYEPDIEYKDKFKHWADFLSINTTDWYDIETCKTMVTKYIGDKAIVDYDKTCIDLCAMDSRFPVYGMWCSFYGISDLSKIILTINKKRK